MKKVGDLLFIAAVLLAGCCLPILLADFFWVFDLFSSLLPQAALSSFLLLVLAIFLKKKLSIYISGLTFGLMSLLIMINVWSFWQAPSDEGTKTVSVLSANVLSSNTRYGDMISLFEREDPDILVVTEINNAWAEHILASSIKNYPYRSLHPREDNFGIAVFSKLPFEEGFYEDQEIVTPLLSLRFDTWTLFAVHPIPPMSNSYDIALKKYFQTVVEMAQKTGTPVAVAGDFNSTLWSSNMKIFRKENFRTSNYKIFGWTWPDNFPLFAVQIDHVLIKGMTARKFDVLEGAGSDHYPIKAILKTP